MQHDTPATAGITPDGFAVRGVTGVSATTEPQEHDR